MITTAALVLVLAISLDSFLAGLSYGCAGIRVPPASLAIPGLISAFVFFSAMSAGSVMAGLLSASVARWIGGALLVVLGAYALSNGNGNGNGNGAGHNVSLTLNFMGIILHVVRDSRAADMDRSKVIDPREAAVLGTALALDAFGVGLGAALAGFPIWEMSLLAGAITPTSIALGAALGRISHAPNTGLMRRLPPWTLIGIGLIRLL